MLSVEEGMISASSRHNVVSPSSAVTDLDTRYVRTPKLLRTKEVDECTKTSFGLIQKRTMRPLDIDLLKRIVNVIVILIHAWWLKLTNLLLSGSSDKYILPVHIAIDIVWSESI